MIDRIERAAQLTHYYAQRRSHLNRSAAAIYIFPLTHQVFSIILFR